jgi:hypothetical protein
MARINSKNNAGGLARTWQGSAAPRSGTATDATLVGSANPGDLYTDTNTYTVYVNEGTQASPYWTPTSYDQPGIRAVFTDFRETADVVAVAGTTMSVEMNTGIRVFGDGAADTDSGLTVANVAEVGNVATIVTTNEAAHLLALGMGEHEVANVQPDTNGPCVIDIVFSHVSAITLRNTFIGFIGTLADALVAPVTGATTTLTLVQDDVAGMGQFIGLTDTDGLFLPHNKGNAAASIETTATGVDLSTTISAAGTDQRWRAELAEDGDITVFVDKAQVGTIAIALDVDEEVTPVFFIESTSAATKSATVKKVAMWYKRV